MRWFIFSTIKEMFIIRLCSQSLGFFSVIVVVVVVHLIVVVIVLFTSSLGNCWSSQGVWLGLYNQFRLDGLLVNIVSAQKLNCLRVRSAQSDITYFSVYFFSTKKKKNVRATEFLVKPTHTSPFLPMNRDRELMEFHAATSLRNGMRACVYVQACLSLSSSLML